jgi:hypothetical protein
MAKYLIEVPHSGEKIDCLRSVEIFHSTGNHFLINADWGCMDGEHKAWFILDASNKEEVLRIVPPAYRKDTKITQLNKFRPNEVEELMKHHDT